MANELVVSGSVKHVPTGITHQVNRKVMDQTTNLLASGVVDVGTSAGAFDLSDLTNAGVAYFQNLDSNVSNRVEIGIEVSSTFYPVLDIRPGMPQILDLSSAVKTTTPLQHKADSGTIKLYYAIYEE